MRSASGTKRRSSRRTARRSGTRSSPKGPGRRASRSSSAALTTLPVLGVPIESKALSGLDSLYSIVQMPPGIPVGTLAIGRPGAVNAALFAAAVLALSDPEVAQRLEAWRKRQTEAVPETPVDDKP